MKLSLASALAVIGKESDALESRADSVLKIVKAKKIGDVRTFNAEVRKAYRANGWKRPLSTQRRSKAIPLAAFGRLFIFLWPLDGGRLKLRYSRCRVKLISNRGLGANSQQRFDRAVSISGTRQRAPR